MKFPRNVRLFTGQLDVAPFAAVFFLLVLFVLLQSSLAPTPGVRVQLPMATPPAPPGTDAPALVVTVDRHEQLYFDHQVTDQARLRAQLRLKVQQSREPLTLIIQADASVRHAAIVRVASVAGNAGIGQVLIKTRPPLFSEGAPPQADPP
ncbi:MAG: hypothetical protein FJ387_17560 [Verrucomicrobia bacterium]|nr:hypothetical protein [Verrucomicrobiota bacterium]